MERVRGIEPPCSAWEADILPLNYTRGFFCIIAGPKGKCKHFFRLNLQDMVFQEIHKNPFTNRSDIAIIYNKKTKEVMTMKVLFAVPADIDELIFAGETTVPSDR